MDFFTLSLLALGLSADAFAVALSNGICDSHVTKLNAIKTALTFGCFQGMMPILGFLLGSSFSEIITRYQHWIAIFLLGSIGLNMITEAIRESKEPCEVLPVTDVFTPKNLILQGIATSIDALAAGVSLAVLEINILASAVLIGVITFSLCAFGVMLGNKFGALLGQKARLIGGMIIIAIGLKIFITNWFYAKLHLK